jgi:hypothetical protein
LFRLYKYFYYRVYQFGVYGPGSWKDPVVAAASAQTALFALIALNIWTVLAVIEVITGIRVSFVVVTFLANLHGTARILFYVIGIAVLAMIGSFKSYWKRIVVDFEQQEETRTQRTMRAIGLWVYCVAWVSLWYACTLYSAKYH